MNRLHSYIVRRDFGFAPNPFHGLCTLAACRPDLRNAATIGDWVLGTGAKHTHHKPHNLDLSKNMIYLMRVDDKIEFDAYWDGPQYRQKRPLTTGSWQQAYGDNIYPSPANKPPDQVSSHHSLSSGAVHQGNLRKDKKHDAVLISRTFWYFGINAPRIPKKFRKYRLPDGSSLSVCAVKQQRLSKALDPVKDEFVNWVQSRWKQGIYGRPVSWPSIRPYG